MQPSASSGNGRRERLHQHEGRAQVDRHVKIPARAVRALQVVILEGGSIVDEAAERPESVCRARHQGFDLGLNGEIGPERHGAAAGLLDACNDIVGGIARLAMVHRNRPAVARQRLGNSAADADRAAGDQSRPRHHARCFHGA